VRRLKVIAPEHTPRWLVTTETFLVGQDLVEVAAPDDDAEYEKNFRGWKFYQPLTVVIFDLASVDKARAYYEEDGYRHVRAGDEMIRRALDLCFVMHEGSEVWWCNPHEGPIQAVTLYDLVDWYEQPRDDLRCYYMRPMWMISMAQWKSGAWPSPELGGPPEAAY
jgi:hypothetical protein